MKKKLLAMLAAKSERKTALVAKGVACEDVAELRSINAEMDTLNGEIAELQAMADAAPDDGAPADPTPAERTAAVNGGVPDIVKLGTQPQARKTDIDGLEYRKAFMDNVLRGTPISPDLRADESTTKSDIGTAIPTILLNKIIENMESTGMILPLVNHTSFAPGMSIPISSVKPVATWVAEGKTSDRQKKTTGAAITFTNFKLRCEISMSMETSVMAISAFEASFVRQVSAAMVKAQEQAIINGVGTASPKGILTETPNAGQEITASALSYDLLIEAEAALPQAYESGAVYLMTKKTFLAYTAIKDSSGQLIARTNYGITGAPERTLLGRAVHLCGDYMDSFSVALTPDKVFAVLFNMKDYTLNTNYNMGIQRKQDWDTEDMLTKAVMACDGKVVDKGSLVTIAKVAE